MWPYSVVPSADRAPVSVFLFALTLLISVILGMIGPTPPGSVLQTAGTAEKACKIIDDAWGPAGTIRAIRNVWADFPFIVAYVLAFSFGCQVVGAGRTLGLVLAYAMLVAGALDVIEDIGLLMMLHGRITDTIARFTSTCAYAKYGIIGAAIAYMLLRPIIDYVRR